MMAARSIPTEPGEPFRKFPGYVHDSKLGRKGTRYLTKKTQKITRRDLGAQGDAMDGESEYGKEKALVELPPQAIAAWAVACYRTHLVESFGPMAELRSTLRGDPSHNVPARALLVRRVNKRDRYFYLKWRSVAPETVDTETGKYGLDRYRQRTGCYVESRVIKPSPKHPPDWCSADALSTLPKGLGVKPEKGIENTLSPVRLLTVSRPAASPTRKLQPRLIVASEYASLSTSQLESVHRQGIQMLRERVCEAGCMASLENPYERATGEKKFWRQLTDMYYGPPPVPLIHIPIHHEESSDGVLAPTDAGLAENEPKRAPP